MSPKIDHVAVNSFMDKQSSGDSLRPATVLIAGEREMFQLLAEGKRTPKLAGRCLFVQTIESHRYNIMERLDLKQPAKSIKHTLREGVNSLDTWLSMYNYPPLRGVPKLFR